MIQPFNKRSLLPQHTRTIDVFNFDSIQPLLDHLAESRPPD